MSTNPDGFFARLTRLFSPPTAEERDAAACAARIRAMEMDLAERDQTIAGMKKEFELLRRQAEADTADAGAAELETLAKRLASLLSQIPTMRSLHDEGKEIRVPDLFKLLEKIEKCLHDIGMEPIGAVGERDRFTTSRHQRMSGGDVNDGDPVRVRFIGYRFRDKVLTKAMVSREE